MKPAHISTVPDYAPGGHEAVYEPDGICHCDPQPDSSPLGECPRCHRLDVRTVRLT